MQQVLLTVRGRARRLLCVCKTTNSSLDLLRYSKHTYIPGQRLLNRLVFMEKVCGVFYVEIGWYNVSERNIIILGTFAHSHTEENDLHVRKLHTSFRNSKAPLIHKHKPRHVQANKICKQIPDFIIYRKRVLSDQSKRALKLLKLYVTF